MGEINGQKGVKKGHKSHIQGIKWDKKCKKPSISGHKTHIQQENV